jgi:hypothetical protein
MMRCTFLLFSLVAACTIGNPGGANLPDSPPPPPDAPSTCLNAVTPGIGGPTNPADGVGGSASCAAGSGSGSGSAACNHQIGEDCLSCHGAGNNTGDGAPLFTIAGTLYSDMEGTQTLGGAIIETLDGTGATLQLTTANDGAFWTGAPFTAPLTVKATQCPGTHSMLTTTTGDCNQVGCHDSTSVNGRVYLIPGQP